ncbi:hypothetical protein SASPL_150625 [Salvia splendens]|uniref:Integrase catalytic domain-containing protein n=1 Tax=Salvia splendens TaxID=180675 RepID=A0A8X8W731_SALSN|nr:hypothetical protein SASPL_150625 [Salvia splendens]
MCPIRERFFYFEELNGGLVYMGNDSPCKTAGIGSIKLRNQDGSTRILKDVRYVPQLKKNLISLGALESKGLVVMMRDGILKATSGALVMLKGVRKNNLYYYQGSTVVGTVATTTSSKKDAEATKLWHLRLGHAEFCEHCVMGKQRRVKFGTAIHNTKGILDYVHSDVRVWVYTMKSKIEVLGIFLKWKAQVEYQMGRKIKVLRSDNGGEYKSDHFQDVCQECGIVRNFTVRNTPQQNGVSEHMNRTLVEKVRCMLSNAGLDRKF